jgi:hypothetical protein
MGLFVIHAYPIYEVSLSFYVTLCFIVFLLAKMDSEAVKRKVRKMIQRGGATLRAVALHVAWFLIITAILLGTIRLRFGAAVETQIYTDDELGFSQWAVYIGVVTIFLGFLFLALGIPILAYLYLTLSERLRHQDEQNGTHPGSNMKAHMILLSLPIGSP